MSKLKHEDILNDPDFKDLSRQKFTISIILTVLELVLYFGFIGLIAFNKPFLAQKLSAGRGNHDRDPHCRRHDLSFLGVYRDLHLVGEHQV